MLKKLSLAALVAMSGVSFASATPLTEAIKNVDFGGYLRLRAYYDNPKEGSKTRHYRTTALFKFTIPVSEEVKFNTAYAFDWSIYGSGKTVNEATGASNPGAAPSPGNVKFFLQYSKNGLNAIFGKIPVPTPVTATGVGEAISAGAIVSYNVNPNITVAAAYLDSTVGLDLAGVPMNKDKKVLSTGKNIYALAAIYNQDNLNAQAWYFNMEDAIDSDIVLTANYKLNNAISFRVDFATAELDDKKVVDSLDVNDSQVGDIDPKKTQTYFNIAATYKQAQLCAKVGYAQTGKDGGVVVLDGDSPLASVLPTEQKTGIANTADTNAFYGKVGYQIDPKMNAFVAASFINDNSSSNKDYNEYLIGAKYQYTKKMNIYAYYSILDGSGKAKDDDNDEVRVEFKYTF